MIEHKNNVILGALLHDIGKILYRSHDGRNHSTSGYDFLKEQLGILNKDILDSVRFHHYKEIQHASLKNDSLAYIVYIADNIASFIDRRENLDAETSGFTKSTTLFSVFNILNGNKESKKYSAKTLDKKEGINLPSNEVVEANESFYSRVISGIKENLKYLDNSKDYLNSYLQVLENYLTFVPSSTQMSEYVDISLYDHVKMTAMFASSIYDFLIENELLNFKDKLFQNTKSFYDEKAFLLVSADISGIQSYIYNITKENALKSLRTRSFYLEMIMEVFIDEILDRTNNIRSNLIYSGGGHCYLLLSNTKSNKAIIETINKELNNWLKKMFGIELFMAVAYEEVSANSFRNIPNGSYSNIYISLSDKLQQIKSNKYSSKEISALNNKVFPQHERECKVCYRLDNLNSNDLCQHCQDIINASNKILDNEFFVLIKDSYSGKDSFLDMPFNNRLFFVNKTNMLLLQQEKEYIRAYTKNNAYTGDSVNTRLWLGDYYSSKLIEELTDSKTINRIGVLRADVDNLGKTMIEGFSDDLRTISRTTTLSRNLSMFFKYEMNRILENPTFFIENKGRRKIVIIYSGGDDVFLVGGWEDVIAFSIDLKNYLKLYSQDTLTLSAGLGIYHPHYPIYNMASEVGRLEEIAKSNEYMKDGVKKSKNSICIFSDEFVFNWENFEKNIVCEKLETIKLLYKITPNLGKGFIYKLLEYLRNLDNEKQINIARLAYILARIEPKKNKNNFNDYDQFKIISNKIYLWAKDKQERKEFIVALYIYIYLMRGEKNG